MWYVAVVVFFSSIDVVDEDPHVLEIMLWKQVLAVDQVPLHLRILNVQNLIVKLLNICTCHVSLVKLQIVFKYDFELLGPNMCTPVHNLSLVSLQVLWNLAEAVPVLSVDLWNDIADVLVEQDVLHESYFALGWLASFHVLLNITNSLSALCPGILHLLGHLLLLFDLFKDIWHLAWWLAREEAHLMICWRGD